MVPPILFEAAGEFRLGCTTAEPLCHLPPHKEERETGATRRIGARIDSPLITRASYVIRPTPTPQNSSQTEFNNSKRHLPYSRRGQQL